jgi:5'-nucleotidase / UDP-sugar diphosphatase
VDRIAQVARRALAIVVFAIVAIVSTGPARAGHGVRSGRSAEAFALPRLAAQQEPASAPRDQTPVTFLQINDVYSTVPVDGAGGLARVATYKRQLAAAGRTPFLVLAGDFLSPSVASTIFRGEQMIAALNAVGVDLATLGNHEFDFGDDALIQRMHDARWQWVVSNVVDTRTGLPIGGAAPYVVRAFGRLKVGFIGLCLTTGEISRERLTHTRLVDPIEAAKTYVPRLKSEGANVIVAVTHLPFDEDRALVEALPDVDLVIGGHEHYPITAVEGRAFISKAGSDARWVARIDVNRRQAGAVERFYELVPITSALAEEPGTAGVVASYEKRLGAEMDRTVGDTTVPLDAEHKGAAETNLGDFVADAFRDAVHADVGLTNSGGIRGNRMYPAGPLTRRTIVAILPFDNTVCKIEVPGRVLLEALDHGVSRLPRDAGQFPQVSGLTMRVDAGAPAGQRVRDVTIDGRRIDAERTYTVALPDYILKGGDGYAMFASARVLVGPESGDLAATTLERYVASRGSIAPKTDGRITIVR